MSTELEFESIKDEDFLQPSATQQQNSAPVGQQDKPKTFTQAFAQSPRRQAALIRAAELIKARKEREAPKVNFPSVSVRASAENLAQKKSRISAAGSLMKQHHRDIEMQRTQNLLAYNQNRIAINSRIKYAREEVLGEIGQKRQNAIQQHARKQTELNALHKVKQSTVGLFDSPGAPFKKLGMLFGHWGRKLGARIGLGATLAKYNLMTKAPVRAALTSARKSKLRSVRRKMKKDFKTHDHAVRDNVKAEKQSGDKLRTLALRKARAEHRQVKRNDREAHRPIRRHQRQQRADWLKAKGNQVAAFGHGVGAGITHLAKKPFTRTSKGPGPGGI